MAVIDIRGTHGSGKSWIMRQLLQQFDHEPITEKGKQIGCWLQEPNAALVGRYPEGKDCGGCDSIPKPNEVVRRVKLFATRYSHVLLEGILVSHTFKRYSCLAQELRGYGYTFYFLDTPMNVCIARMRQRRLDRGNTKHYNPIDLVKDWHQIWERTRAKCAAAGHKVVVLNWKNPLPMVLEGLKDALG